MATNGEMVKRKLFDLRVVDLKAELENRNLDKAGIKVVLLERLQQALEKEGHNCDEYFFEVTESPIAKKPTKRTNKKLTRDDESETHSNVDESQNDLNLEDDDKFDSDEDRIDEKFFQVLETTEDTINLSIEEEEEKLLIEEDISSEGEKQADSDDFKRNGKSSGETVNVSRSPKRESTKSQAQNSTSNSTVKLSSSKLKMSREKGVCSNGNPVQSDQEATVACGEVATNTSKDSAAKDCSAKSGDQGKATASGGSGGDSSGIRVEEKGESGSGVSGGLVSSSAAKNTNSNGSESKENAATEGNSSSATAGTAVVRLEETSSGATTVATSPNKAKSGAVKEGTKLSERAKLARPMVSGKNLWVTGLSSATRATDLKSLFSKHGKVLGAKVVSNARSSVSRCYGFITMATAEEASKCIQHLHRTELHGRMISVERAKADPLGPGRKVAVRQATTAPVPKKNPVKKDAPTTVVRAEGPEKKIEEETIEKKEKSKAKDDENVKESSGPEAKDLIDEDIQVKEVVGGDILNEEKGSKKSDDRRDSIRRSTRDSRERRGSERSYEHHRENFLSHRRPYFRDNKFMRRPFMRRPIGYRSMMRRTTLTFDRIRAERLRQRAREEEREMRDSERKRRLDIARQREIERRQREEAVRLERERERLRIEREKLERERAEVLRLEREKQKLERERIEREREELRRRERMSFNSRMDEHRRPVKRSYNSFHGGRDVDYEERKRANISGGGPRRIENFERRSDHRTDSIRGGGGGGIGRRDSHVPERGNDSRTERFERPVSRDTDLRGHGREDRSVSYRDSSDLGQSRTVKDEWKATSERGRGHRDSGKGMSSSSYGNDGGRSDSRYGDRGNDTWHGSSQSESRSGGGSKPYNTGSGGGWGGTDRKSDSQWGSSRNDSWGSGGGSGGIGSVRSQQLGMSQSIMGQGQSSMFESGSGSGGGGGGGGGSSGMIGLGIGGGSSYSSDRFDSYKGMNSMRRY